jgi:hypothetical protein
VNDHSSTQPATHDPLTALRGQFPRWEAWVGVSGILYARRRLTSPPAVLRDVTGEGLARQIREWEGRQR